MIGALALSPGAVTIIQVVASAVLGGGLMAGYAAFRKVDPEVRDITVTTTGKIMVMADRAMERQADELERLYKRIDALESTVAALQSTAARVDQLQRERDQAVAERDALTSKVQQLEAKVRGLETQVAALRSKGASP